jgi:ParB/RepB/Spo0J family partition protein
VNVSPTSPTTVNVVLADLREPPDTNPNVMRLEDYGKLVESIRAGGFMQPILARRLPDGFCEIVDGVHRKRAAEAAGLTDIPCVVATLTEDQARAFRVSMNRLRGELDMTIVAREFRALAEHGWSMDALAATGFTTEEVTALLEVAAEATQEAADAIPDDFGAEPETRKAEDVDWTLELTFDSRATLNRVKRRLRKLAGKGGTLEAGMLKAISED